MTIAHPFFRNIVIACFVLLAGCGGGGGGSSDGKEGGNGGSGNGSGSTPPQTGYFTGMHRAFMQTSGKVIAAYLPGYEIDAGYKLEVLPAENLTHLIYAFLTICGPGQNAADTAVCAGKADFELASNATSAGNAHHAGLQAFKKRAPKVKVLVSIGGGAASAPFFYLAKDTAKRAVFIQSVVDYLTAHPAFDGVDIDWEAPTDDLGAHHPPLGSPADSAAYVALLQELRTALDRIVTTDGGRYLLTSAVPTLRSISQAVDYANAQAFVDYFFAMTYDYYGSWSDEVGHHTALHPSSGRFGIQTLLDAGVTPAKLVHGVAAYSRGWGNCTNTTNPMEGTGDGNYNGEGGTERYSTLANAYFDSEGKGINGYEVRYDTVQRAYYLWHPGTATFIGYDDPRAVVRKAEYAVERRLAGVFMWELGQDNGDLLNAMNIGVGNRTQ